MKNDTPRLEELITSRLPVGTSKRMDKVLYGGELRSALIRAAIEKELRKREREKQSA
jgi:metal-responsive CopG/Arc/MetJ family transcriptional regulator